MLRQRLRAGKFRNMSVMVSFDLAETKRSSFRTKRGIPPGPGRSKQRGIPRFARNDERKELIAKRRGPNDTTTQLCVVLNCRTSECILDVAAKLFWRWGICNDRVPETQNCHRQVHHGHARFGQRTRLIQVRKKCFRASVRRSWRCLAAFWPGGYARQAAGPESEPIAKAGKPARTLSSLLSSPTEFRCARRTFRNPAKKVRAYFLPYRPGPGSACSFRHACISSRSA